MYSAGIAPDLAAFVRKVVTLEERTAAHWANPMVPPKERNYVPRASILTNEDEDITYEKCESGDSCYFIFRLRETSLDSQWTKAHTHTCTRHRHKPA